MAEKRDTKVIKTQFARRITRNLNVTRLECWEAETEDRIWRFVREESSGTPWLVFHNPSVEDGSYEYPVAMLGSLPKCQKYVEAGHADFDLAQRKGEK